MAGEQGPPCAHCGHRPEQHAAIGPCGMPSTLLDDCACPGYVAPRTTTTTLTKKWEEPMPGVMLTTSEEAVFVNDAGVQLAVKATRSGGITSLRIEIRNRGAGIDVITVASFDADEAVEVFDQMSRIGGAMLFAELKSTSSA